jgi:hypothetical protein
MLTGKAPRKATRTATGTPQTPWCHRKWRSRMSALGLSLIAGLVASFVNEANAVICPPPTGYKSIGGTCYYVNTVGIHAELKNTGKLEKNPKSFSAVIAPTGVGVLYCKNKAGKQPPGQRLVSSTQQLTCSTPVEPSDVVSQQNGGTAQVVCTAKLSDEDLAALGQLYCATGQFAVDFVPCEFYSDVTYTDETDPTQPNNIETAKHHCKLDTSVCEAIPWDKTTDSPKETPYPCEGPIQ